MTMTYSKADKRKMLADRAAELMNAALGDASSSDLRSKADACVSLATTIQICEEIRSRV